MKMTRITTKAIMMMTTMMKMKMIPGAAALMPDIIEEKMKILMKTTMRTKMRMMIAGEMCILAEMMKMKNMVVVAIQEEVVEKDQVVDSLECHVKK